MPSTPPEFGAWVAWMRKVRQMRGPIRQAPAGRSGCYPESPILPTCAGRIAQALPRSKRESLASLTKKRRAGGGGRLTYTAMGVPGIHNTPLAAPPSVMPVGRLPSSHACPIVTPLLPERPYVRADLHLTFLSNENVQCPRRHRKAVDSYLIRDVNGAAILQHNSGILTLNNHLHMALLLRSNTINLRCLHR